MPSSTTARILRGKPPLQKIPRTKYRRALPELIRDFDGRCAYSMQHFSRAGGMSCMEVDHFDPRTKKERFQNYNNLFLATRHCNGAKRDRPTHGDVAAGLRFINPCEDWDYGKYIFEDPISHRLIGTTPQAIYHIRYCDLNAAHLVAERRDRSAILKMLTNHFVLRSGITFDSFSQAVGLLRNQVERMIPEVPASSGFKAKKIE